MEEWKSKKLNSDEKTADATEEENIYTASELQWDDEGEMDEENATKTVDGPKQFVSHVPVPSQQDIEDALVRRKKMELLQKYTSESLRAEAEEAKKLLGV